MMDFRNMLHSSVRFLVPQCHDMSTMPELQAAYACALLVDSLHMKAHAVRIQSCYPYVKHHHVLRNDLPECAEEYLVFFLENFYHSSTYVLREVVDLLPRLKHKKIIIQSYKINERDAEMLMRDFPHVIAIARTDIEYVLYEHLVYGKDLDQIANMTVRTADGVEHTHKEMVEYDLGLYLRPAYTNNIAFRDKDHAAYIASLIDDGPLQKFKAQLFGPQVAMLSTGRGCKYKCTYCFRGVKFSSVRKIPLHVIDADLAHLKSSGYTRVYLYDDCFVTTNRDRLPQVIELLKKHDLSYYIAVRYEVITPEVMEQLLALRFFKVQIGLQSTTHNAAHKRSFDAAKLGEVMKRMNAAGAGTSIDVIMGLPGESAQDFMNTVEYAISLNPACLVVNTLFINPGTELARTASDYGIKARRVDFNVPYMVSSNTFSEQDMNRCRVWLRGKVQENPHINFTLR